MLSKEELNKFWEKRAKHPAPCHYMNPVMDKYAWTTRTNALLKIEDLLQGTNLFDIGCGDGAYTDYLAGMAEEVVGLDRNDMVAIARTKYKIPQFVVGSSDDIDTRKVIGLSHVITLLTVYDFMTIGERARLREHLKAARPGTLVVILDLFPTKVPEYQKGLDYKEVESKDKKLHDMYSAGYDVERVVPVNYMDTKLFYMLGKNKVSYYLTRFFDKVLALFCEPKYSLVVFRKL